jgi:hypothetical protein
MISPISAFKSCYLRLGIPYISNILFWLKLAIDASAIKNIAGIDYFLNYVGCKSNLIKIKAVESWKLA